MTLAEKIERRMGSGEPFTYSELCEMTPDKSDKGRAADKTIQRWRRKGWIAFTREGRNVVWRLTDAGRQVQRAQ